MGHPCKRYGLAEPYTGDESEGQARHPLLDARFREHDEDAPP